jgi:hypothetical protein
MSLFTSGFDSPFEIGATSYEGVAGEVSGGVDARFGNVDPNLAMPVADGSGAASTGGTPVPDFAIAVAGDPAGEALPLGVIASLPDTVHLDFLFEICWPEVCFRDAHFMDPAGSGLGSGTFAAGAPFHIREGFPVTGDEPLGEGFDVVVYVTPMDVPGEFGGAATGATVKYTADHLVRGEADGCGPTYRNQEAVVACQWFVHEFPDGLPAGRHSLWVVWEAPCEAWIGLGFAENCTHPDEVLSLFTSGFDSPFGDVPLYVESDQRPTKVGGTGG